MGKKNHCESDTKQIKQSSPSSYPQLADIVWENTDFLKRFLQKVMLWRKFVLLLFKPCVTFQAAGSMTLQLQ